MKAKRFSIFTRISILLFSLITILGILFMGLTYFAITEYHLASTQLLNKDVAAHIAKFTSPYDKNGINKSKADSVFQNAMIISPSAQVYFLDTSGNVMDFYGPKKEVVLLNVSLENVKKYIAKKGDIYIKADDPRDPPQPKIFSAAEVISNKKKLGYIYIILGSNEYKTIGAVLFNSLASRLVLKAFIVIIIVSIIFSLLYINRMGKSFNHMISVLQKFQNGDYNARFRLKENDELASVSQAFNTMADLLTQNINKLTQSEKERKDFMANISHDLRTPLAIARGYAETMMIKRNDNTISANEEDTYMQTILNKISQVENMVKHLFEISKMESVEFKDKKEPFVLSEIVQEIVNTYQLTAEARKVALRCAQCQYHVWINADVSLMERVIQNLVDNAIKHTPENGKINVAMMVENSNLVFKIENTGTPIPAGLLEWINTPEQNLNDLISSHKTSGLGLVIVKKILRMNGSILKAYTVNNDTNVFTFQMPVYNF